ncbi:hypothetical protein RRG08_051754 [Elysia crispata]|uniref:Uncharacterized protein n=1 Tax=Elysia crispata TaxID=231223 RepID=A0AAE1B883_9GAST|nr:hypothetical protein RRG08_051754 [Elysia crispata]
MLATYVLGGKKGFDDDETWARDIGEGMENADSPNPLLPTTISSARQASPTRLPVAVWDCLLRARHRCLVIVRL